MATSLVAELAEKLSSATNSLDFDEQTLFINTSTNKVAIGTNAPVTDLTIEGPITIKEQADADADTVAYGQIWVNTATPNQLYFTTDAGDDVQITDGTALAGAFDTDAAQVFNESGADVDFRVESDNNVNMIFVDGGNDRVGIGTSAPGAHLDVRGPVGTGATGAGVLRLSTAETSIEDADQLGRIEFIAPVDTAGDDAITVGASIWAEADATFSSSVNETDLVFATGASGAATEKMRIASDGNVGIADNNPSYKLSVTGDIYSSSSLGIGTAPSGTTGQIRATDDITAFYSSDISLKENISPISNALDKISQISGVQFDWNKEYIDKNGGEDGYFVRKRDVGVIAQEIQKVLPEVVAKRSNGTLAVKYDRIIALLIEAIKELKNR